VEDIVKDVIARDQALDAFETFTRKKMLDRMAARQKKVAEVESQIASLQEQRERLIQEAKTDEQHWTAWLEQKRAYERDLSRTISYLVDRVVVTIDEQ